MIFVNYRAHPEQPSLHAAIARFLLATFLIWKLCAYDWPFLLEWPEYLFRWPLVRAHVATLVPVTIVALACVAVGAFLPLTTLVAAAGLILLGDLHQAVDNHGKRLLIPAMLLLLFGIHRHTDTLSFDSLWRRARLPAGERLTTSRPPPANLTGLRDGQLLIALTYFLVSAGRILYGSWVDWTLPGNLRRTVRIEALQNLGIEATFGGPMVVAAPDWLVAVAAHGTIILELSLLIAVLARWSVTPIILGLMGLHVGIFVTMHLLFLESIFLLLLFANWSTLWSATERRELISVSVDPRTLERSRWLATFLHVMAQLDIRGVFRVGLMPRPPLGSSSLSSVVGETNSGTGIWLSCIQGDTEMVNSRAAVRLLEHFTLLRPLAISARIWPSVRRSDRQAPTDVRRSRVPWR